MLNPQDVGIAIVCVCFTIVLISFACEGKGMGHFVSGSCGGEFCGMCYREAEDDQTRVPATHKVGEEIPLDDPNQMRHNLTQYVCCKHFQAIVGSHATASCSENINYQPLE